MRRIQWSLQVTSELDRAARERAGGLGVTLSAWARDVLTTHLNSRPGIHVELEPDELEAFEASARALGLSVPGYLRSLGRRESGLPTV